MKYVKSAYIFTVVGSNRTKLLSQNVINKIQQSIEMGIEEGGHLCNVLVPKENVQLCLMFKYFNIKEIQLYKCRFSFVIGKIGIRGKQIFANPK